MGAELGGGGWGGGPYRERGGPEAFFGGPGERGGGGPGGFFGRHRGHHGGPGGEDGFFGGHGGPFGVRRPLRFLAHKLDLSEAQVADLAKILDDLKTERAQAEVDLRRSIAAFADSIEGAAFGEDRAKEGGAERVKSAEHLRDAVVTALSKIHALLEEDQRKQFAYLIRTGVVSM